MAPPRTLNDITILRTNPASLGPKVFVLFVEASSPPQVIQIIAASINIPLYIIHWKEGTKEAHSMMAYISKNCSMYQITSKWKLFSLVGGSPDRIFAYPKSDADVKEIITHANSSSSGAGRSYAQPPQQHSGMSLSGGPSAQQIQILPDKRLSEPDYFIPYNQEWRKYAQ